jgi:hypothetical protein
MFAQGLCPADWVFIVNLELDLMCVALRVWTVTPEHLLSPSLLPSG